MSNNTNNLFHVVLIVSKPISLHFDVLVLLAFITRLHYRMLSYVAEEHKPFKMYNVHIKDFCIHRNKQAQLN